eukprot:scaffold153541_cov13-Prasinocladus_malaysianus.AAC.1
MMLMMMWTVTLITMAVINKSNKPVIHYKAAYPDTDGQLEWMAEALIPLNALFCVRIPFVHSS